MKCILILWPFNLIIFHKTFLYMERIQQHFQLRFGYNNKKKTNWLSLRKTKKWIRVFWTLTFLHCLAQENVMRTVQKYKGSLKWMNTTRRRSSLSQPIIKYLVSVDFILLEYGWMWYRLWFQLQLGSIKVSVLSTRALQLHH